MAYSDPRKSAKFVDDNHLRTRDLSGGPPRPEDTQNLRHSTDFGQTAKSVSGGEAEDVRPEPGEDEDEMYMAGATPAARKVTGKMPSKY
jgi:hypothetical protein